LTRETETKLSQTFESFLAQWKSHGTPVHGNIQLRYSRFVIVQADPNDHRPSGCSIDNLKRSVGGILEHFSLDTVDNAYVWYKDQAGEVSSTHFREIGNLVASGELTPDTLIFDHTLSNSDDLTKWEVALKDSWLKRYLKSSPTS
ncbi:MAG: hypothetical protein AAF824_18255, partial [Bacteroidota bacterium]